MYSSGNRETYTKQAYSNIVYKRIANFCHRQVGHPDGRSVQVFSSGVRVTRFSDGTRRTKWPDGSNLVAFPNKDLRRVDARGQEDYFFAAVWAVGGGVCRSPTLAQYFQFYVIYLNTYSQFKNLV